MDESGRYNMKKEYRLVLYTVETTEGMEWVAEYPDLKGCCGGGKTQIEAIQDAEDNKEVFLSALEEDAHPVPLPTNPYHSDYSGKCTVRMSKSLHKKLSCLAEEEGVSMNQLIVEAIAERVERKSFETKRTLSTSPQGYAPSFQSIFEIWENMDTQNVRYSM